MILSKPKKLTDGDQPTPRDGLDILVQTNDIYIAK